MSEPELRQSFVRVFEADMRGLRPRPLAVIDHHIESHTLRELVLLRNKEWNVLLRVPTRGARLGAFAATTSCKGHLSNRAWKPFRNKDDDMSSLAISIFKMNFE